MKIFDRLESNVRGYCRSFPVVFTRASGALLHDEEGREYIDFLAGAGTLNYGHNNPLVKPKLLEFLADDGVMHGLDLHTTAKRDLLEAFDQLILRPRKLPYKMQFTGPTGTNAVEAAMKLARTVTGRNNILAFTNAFHGVTLGSVAATGNAYYRDACGVSLGDVTFVPFDGYMGPKVDTVAYLRKLLTDKSSGLDFPAAILVETVQGEGGVNVAGFSWLRKLAELCQDMEILLIVDDIQVGCGRTGPFFSFEPAGIVPDIVVLSKSLGGYGLPMSIVLMRSELDQWKPGQHNGTFRGNNLAFVAAAEVLRKYWSSDTLSREVESKGRMIRSSLEKIWNHFPDAGLSIRGRGMIWGLDFGARPSLAGIVAQEAFNAGVIIETSGAAGQVLKFLPPLVIPDNLLRRGLDLVVQAAIDVLDRSDNRADISQQQSHEQEEVIQ
jgi:diaminobutyrate-2-oxoglutarate transaminase